MGADSSSPITASSSTQEIGGLIASIGQPFEKYEEMVVNHDINGEILMTLIDDEKALTAALKRVGVTNMIHQKAISAKLKVTVTADVSREGSMEEMKNECDNAVDGEYYDANMTEQFAIPDHPRA
eukprot:CAMPEP_0119050580 /NCGR_PEP_ID=MMETSP1177-20130426/70720_1 /TAXON_ID=2985 /ORGANISM="Ochromonas sp, Strain CCMP1899" /LENGTH=124 /DNA_ID=CAMNT_0007029147 /DNA_START=205 /DNA_END=576 /DNA_ORIENTATION=-